MIVGVVLALIATVCGAAPAQAVPVGKAAWGFVYLSSDATYCYAYAYLPSSMSVISGTASLYAGIEPYSWSTTSASWVKSGWRPMSAIPDKIVTNSGWAREKSYDPIKWNGSSPTSYGIPVVITVRRHSGSWAFIGRAYWLNGAGQKIASDNGFNMQILGSDGKPAPYFTCN